MKTAGSEAVPLDTLAEIIINTAVRQQQEKLTNIRDVFNAADLDKSGTLELNEFKILFKLVSETNEANKIFD